MYHSDVKQDDTADICGILRTNCCMIRVDSGVRGNKIIRIVVEAKKRTSDFIIRTKPVSRSYYTYHTNVEQDDIQQIWYLSYQLSV